MDISVQGLRRVQVIKVSGRVDSSSAPQLDQKLKELRSDGHENMVLDLSEVEYMSSAGLRAIVSALRECKKHGGDLCLVSPSIRVAEVMNLAGLTSLFNTYDDTITAVGSF